jgi:hypothetical protein
VWTQYDYDNNGTLDEHESRDFIHIVLQMNESILAKNLGRPIREITQEMVS